MTKVAIPPWNTTGLLPPIDPMVPTGPERSPYFVSLSEVVLRFGTSPERRQILTGFLKYRNRLQAVGLLSGFQWLDGSFLENVESLEGRPPNDLDVVTFFQLPIGLTQTMIQAKDPAVFPRNAADKQAFKAIYFVDPYFVDLASAPSSLVQNGAYWYGVWSHRRDARWKGYLTVDLDPAEDSTAAGHLTVPAPGGAP